MSRTGRNVFYNAKESQLTRQQSDLLARFGLTGNATRNRAAIAAFEGDPIGTNAYRAVQLARAVASGKFGSDRRGPRPKVDWKRQLSAGGNKADYNRRLAAAKARGNAAKAAALREAYRARRRNALAAAAARKAKLARIRRNTGGKLKSFAVNVDPTERARGLVASSMAILVGVVQDLMAIGGTSLSRTVHTLVNQHTSPSARAGVKVATVMTPARLLGWLATQVLRRYGVQADDKALASVFRLAKPVVLGILANKNVDMRPLARAVVLSIEAEQVRKMTASVIKDLLDNYVYMQYTSTSEGGMICQLCSKATCNRVLQTDKATNAAAAAANARVNRQYTAKLAKLLSGAMRAFNQLLSVEGRKLTLTMALRQAMDTYASRALVLFVQAGSSKFTNPALAALARFDFMHKLALRMLKKWGLTITKEDLQSIVSKDLAAINAFINKDFSRPLDPVLVKIVVKARPIGLVRGVSGAALKGRGTSQFCELCKSSYAMCTA